MRRCDDALKKEILLKIANKVNRAAGQLHIDPKKESMKKWSPNALTSNNVKDLECVHGYLSGDLIF